MFRVAWNFLTSMIRFAFDRFRVVDHEEHVRRVSLCINCKRFDVPTRRCDECGCFVVPKAKIKSESCPIKKW